MGLDAVGVGLLIALTLTPSARAQVAVNATITSNYQYRGVSLSGDRPALSVNLTYDHSSGAYGGVSAIGEAAAHTEPRWLGRQVYLGYAGRASPGSSWDVGLSDTNVTQYAYRPYRVESEEIYAGWRSGDMRYYLYYSPHYFNTGLSTLYADISGSIRPANHLRAFGHIGVLTPLTTGEGGYRPGVQYDFSAGVAVALKKMEIQLAWTLRRPGGAIAYGHPQRRSRLALGATYYF